MRGSSVRGALGQAWMRGGETDFLPVQGVPVTPTAAGLFIDRQPMASNDSTGVVVQLHRINIALEGGPDRLSSPGGKSMSEEEGPVKPEGEEESEELAAETEGEKEETQGREDRRPGVRTREGEEAEAWQQHAVDNPQRHEGIGEPRRCGRSLRSGEDGLET